MEIAYAENVWQVISAFAVFVAGFLAFSARPFRSVSRKVSVALYLWHTFFTLYYARFALYNSADARGYFIRSLENNPSFRLGTKAIDFITSIYTQFFGLSYLGTFLVYNIIGAIGLLAFVAAMRETSCRKTARVRLYTTIIAFLPGLSFWSVAIGKDSPALLGTGLLSWAAIDLKRRWVAVLAGTVIYLLVRPHLTAIILVALAFAIIISGKIGIPKKIMIVAVIAAPSVFAIKLAMATLGLGNTDVISSAYAFIESRQLINLQGGSSIDITNMNLPTQMVVYSFGPMFIGANGILGLVASIENVFLLFVVATAVIRIFRGRSSLSPTVKWFYLFFSLSLWMIFAMTTANLGIALRQKWMFMPMLLIFCLSYFPDSKARARAPDGAGK